MTTAKPCAQTPHTDFPGSPVAGIKSSPSVRGDSLVDNVPLERMRMNAKPFNWFSSQYSPPLPLGARILGDSVFNKMEKFSFPSTLKTLKFSLYKLDITSLHLRVCSFAILWFFFSVKETRVLRRNMSQSLNYNSHLREVSRERRSPPPGAWLSLPAAQRDSHVQDGPWVQDIAKQNPTPRPPPPIHSFQGTTPLLSCLVFSPAA